ncbi:MAG: PEGA domain-containing protein [Acidobacteria bacterium]|nr:PEGA domain-containing protein [Acidobacteriota bacterium]
MTFIRTVTLTLATAALLITPALQYQAHAQGRRGERGEGAQQRGARRDAPAPRREAAPPRRGGVVIGAYYRPLYLSMMYDPFYDPFFYPPFYPPYSGPFGRYPRYGARQFFYGDASLRLQVSPRETQVFVDGYYASIVDDFDGVFQRLDLESGGHDIALFLPGYRTLTEKVLLQRGRTLQLRHTMMPLATGETSEPPAVAPAPERPSQRAPARVDPGEDETRETAPRIGDASYGALAIRVQPADAEVLIDGERWEGPSVDEALVVQLAPGAHRVEVRKDGYRGYAAQVDVHNGQTTKINVSLPRQ